VRRIRRRSKSDDGVFELPKADIEAARQIDPDAGILSMIVYWRPKKNSEGVDVGEKAHMSIFLPCDSNAPCPCGSLEPFGTCCSHQPVWNVLTPNPGMDGYDFVRPISLTYIITDKDLVIEQMQADSRFQLVGNENNHFLFLDDPRQVSKYGIVNFGDITIKEPNCLCIETMSNKRMQYLRGIIEGIFGNVLSLPYYEEGELATAAKPEYE